MSSSGLPSTRETWSSWRECSEGHRKFGSFVELDQKLHFFVKKGEQHPGLDGAAGQVLHLSESVARAVPY